MLFALGAVGVAFIVVGMLASIALHEVGHLVPAKRSGVKVTQYMVGFGPTLWSTKRGDTEYGVKAIPFGGYIRMIGMYPPRQARGENETHLRPASTGWMRAMVEDARSADVERVAPEDVDRVFYKQRVRNKLLIMLGGPTMNLIIGLVLLIILLLGYGVPKTTTTLQTVQKCVVSATSTQTECLATDPLSPAAKAGFLPGDRVLAVDGTTVPDWDAVRAAIRPATGRELTFLVQRDGKPVTLRVTPVKNTVFVDAETTKTMTVGFLGVSPVEHMAPLSVGQVPSALWTDVERTASGVARVPNKIGGIWQAAFGGGKRDQNSPVSVVGVGRLGGEVGARAGVDVKDKFAFLIGLVASLNLALFFFNLIPLLPLDGGHVAGALFEGLRRQVARLRRRPDPGFADVAKMLPVAYAVAMALIGLSVLLMYADIVNPVRLSQ